MLLIVERVAESALLTLLSAIVQILEYSKGSSVNLPIEGADLIPDVESVDSLTK